METLHPVAAHFSVVLPLVALTFQALYMMKSNESYNKASLVIIVFSSIFITTAYFTGSSDGKNVVGDIFSTFYPAGLEDLKEHAALGLYLTLLVGVLALIKVANFFLVKRKTLEILITIMLVIASVLVIEQASEGGEIVYEHGALFEAHEIKDTLRESLQEINGAEDQNERMDILEEAIKAVLKIEE